MPLRCVYTDLDGTLLGPGGSLFRGPDGNFSLRQGRALEACHRAGVEVVIMSGRREVSVLANARMLGQTSYISEAGCAVTIDGERTLLTGSWTIDEDGTPAQKIEASGVPNALFEHFGKRLEWHAPWHTGREFSLLMRGAVDVTEANSLIAELGHDDLRFLDNGAIGRRIEGVDEQIHAYHVVPGAASKGGAVAFHSQARGYATEDCIAVGDSIEDLEAAVAVGTYFCVANGPVHDEGLREALARFPNANVTEAEMGDGFYEAVVSTLAMRG